MTDSPRIPEPVKLALVARRAAIDALDAASAVLQLALEPHAGETFSIEGVPFKVCGKRAGSRYLRRMTGPEETKQLRAAWRES